MTTVATNYTAIPLSSAATLIFTPQVNATFFNATNVGSNIIYVGGSGVSQTGGLPVQPGQSVTLPFVNSKIYACSPLDVTKTPTDTLSANASLGATALTVASGGAAFTNGMIISINDGVNSERVTVGTGSSGTSVVVSATAHAHASGVTFGQFSSSNGGCVTVSTTV